MIILYSGVIIFEKKSFDIEYQLLNTLTVKPLSNAKVLYYYCCDHEETKVSNVFNHMKVQKQVVVVAFFPEVSAEPHGILYWY